MRRLLAATVIVSGCAAPDAADRCEVRARSFALTAESRKVVGEASPYPADPTLRARGDRLDRDQRARRDAAWDAIAKVLAPVPLAEELPNHAGPDTLPRWHTWYGRDDLKRIFQKVWRAEPASLRLARDPIPDDDLDAGFAWNPRAVEEQASWPEERYRAYVESLDDQAEVDGVGGLHRVQYAPSAARHLLASYADEMRCLEGAPPDAFVDGAPTQPRLTREPVGLAACEAKIYGPYFVATGETLTAYTDADYSISRELPDGVVACGGDGVVCDVDGPGTLWITVSAGLDPVDGELVVETTAPDAPWAGCLDGRFPLDAAVVKADWRRAELAFEVPRHATDADALAAVGAGTVDGDWGEGQGTADPGADDIYTIVTENGDRFRLVALHVMTRELDHWLWTTLWWSPDPDTDFGADRPATVDGVWANYKMCASTAFAEGDADPTGGYAGDHPDLGAALAAVYAGQGGPSWCSNPFLEVGHGNASTNCVGCHQHGGTDLIAEQILASPTTMPASGRVQVRNNFPADYSWATTNGDRIGQMLRDEVLYWDEVP